MIIGNHKRGKEYERRRQEHETYRGGRWDASRKHAVSRCCYVLPMVFVKKGGTLGDYGMLGVRNEDKKRRYQGGKTEGKGIKCVCGV